MGHCSFIRQSLSVALFQYTIKDVVQDVKSLNHGLPVTKYHFGTKPNSKVVCRKEHRS